MGENTEHCTEHSDDHPDVGSVDADERTSVSSSSSSDKSARRHLREEVLPSVTSDERNVGWGDEESRYGDDWYYTERPPHHG
ncbi:hypothetical protein M6D93_04325 [Jatrophihabitans telluris]|uniref:Uncharacterized protein n=1 Tax=Jatrophihabitans telluris TaxID=2038343 RepID=A0ABY4R0F6_9ACTN|nr:hypothetical protein [Jatrophihabitans telluris]UQX89234.1 hypothetical protein M6D93_04325 [Jatrophihabitans telluris]